MIYINDISIIFISVILEAFPMIMLGIVVSSIVEEFVTDEMMVKIIPKNHALGAIVGVIMGLFIPTCDCAVIPITKRLIKKKVPLNVAITFMLSSPIINPVVLFATNYSFNQVMPKMTIYRAIVGVIIAIIIGIIMSLTTDSNQILKENDNECMHCEHVHKRRGKKVGVIKHIDNILKYCKEEFWEVSKYLIIGAIIASITQVVLPKTIIYRYINNKVISTIILMLFAYLISLCSTSDSFVAKTFVGSFSNNSILAFLLLGPMIDIKNTIVLAGNFNKRFVTKLIFLIFIFVFIAAMCVSI